MYPTSIWGWPLCLLRIYLTACWFFVGSLIPLIVAIFRPFNVKNGYLYAAVCNRPILRILGIKLVIEGQIPSDKESIVFIGNHQSIVDLFVFPLCLPHNAISIGKKSIRWVPIFGWVFWLSNHIFIDRKNKVRAVQAMDEAARRLRSQKLSVMVFPEGTRSLTGKLGKFKKGAFHLAEQGPFPIVPMIASRYSNVLNLGRMNAGTIVVRILPRISPPFQPMEKLMDQCFELFEQNLQ